jgi:pimeloyl-ACP methyl ester carboxylesterase
VSKTEKKSFNDLEHRIHFWGEPTNPKLFLIHGFLDVGSSFQYMAQYLSKRYHCIAPDLRGFGHTQHSNNPLGYFFPEYIADLHALFNHYAEGEKLKVVGHSMGGNIVSTYAGTFPEQVSHFINIEGFGVKNMKADDGPKRLKKWVEGLAHLPLYTEYSSLEELVSKLVKRNSRVQTEVALTWAKEMTTRSEGKIKLTADPRHRWVNPYLFQLENAYPFWENITAQCLLVSAEKSEFKKWLEDENGLEQRLSHYPAHSQTKEVKECGHMVHLEKPEELSQYIVEFLESSGT